MQNPVSRLRDQFGFAPTSYPADIVTSTTAANISIAGLAGKAIRVRNMDSSNQIRIAFGPDGATANTNVANGCVIEPGAMEILQPITEHDFMAYAAVAGTPTLNYQPGY